MRFRKKQVVILVLAVFCLLIHFYSLSEKRVESGYSTHFYKGFSQALRSFFGWLPFSIGDLFYGLFIGWILWRIVRFSKLAFSKGPKKQFYINSLYKLFIFCSSIYIVFNIFWGINYNRRGIAWQLGLQLDKYTEDDLKMINGVLITKVNEYKREMIQKNMAYPTNKGLFNMANDAYQSVTKQYPFLIYKPASVKSSMWGWIGNYSGFTGYYNPFTGEAQVNTTGPKFLHAFVTCHEIAHQIGYAKEMEANFVGYLAASNSNNPILQYSVYVDLFVYANRNLYYTDSASARKYRDALDTAVVADLKEWAAFVKLHQNWVEPVVRWIYGKYLQGNEQPNGVLSYDEVTAFLIAYYKKFGKI